MSEIYSFIEPSGKKVPILVSVPHCGLLFPPEIKDQIVETKISRPDDTDWFVHDLYRFVSDLGITIIHAKYHRWVIDLNRSPNNVSLYDDGRIITGLTPLVDFSGDLIYKDASFHPSSVEIRRRLNQYYWPYYRKIQEWVEEQKNRKGIALLWDAHSIRQYLPLIHKKRFPDLILGDNNGRSASTEFSSIVANVLNKTDYSFSYNTPFKGGHITRYFGKPQEGIHALQLEMVKKVYMDDSENNYMPTRAQHIIEVLSTVFQEFIKQL